MIDRSDRCGDRLPWSSLRTVLYIRRCRCTCGVYCNVCRWTSAGSHRLYIARLFVIRPLCTAVGLLCTPCIACIRHWFALCWIGYIGLSVVGVYMYILSISSACRVATVGTLSVRCSDEVDTRRATDVVRPASILGSRIYAYIVRVDYTRTSRLFRVCVLRDQMHFMLPN